jgi:hypothetical protein
MHLWLLYLEKSTSYETPHYAVLSNLLSLHLSLEELYEVLKSRITFKSCPCVMHMCLVMLHRIILI